MGLTEASDMVAWGRSWAREERERDREVSEDLKMLVG